MPRSRKPPRPRDATATREVLLDAATLVFAEQGFAGARVDEIATRAGVNKALIYAYYGDKKGIYRAVLAAHLREFTAAEMSETVLAEHGPRRALEDLVRRYFRMLVQDRPFARLIAWEFLSHAGEGRELILEGAAPFLDLIQELVRRGRANGELRKTMDAELFRSAVIALGLGYTVQHSAMILARKQRGLEYTDEQFLDYVIRLLVERDEVPARRSA
jgi:TetR/AcrR family transcriptional regulator